MKWLYRFFVVLGIIFFCILVSFAYFIIADPYNVRPLFQAMYETNTSFESSQVPSDAKGTTDANTATTPSGGTTVVNENQAKALESVGIDPQSVPAQFTPEQITCFVRILGQARVDTIVAGATPTPSEFFKAKECL